MTFRLQYKGMCRLSFGCHVALSVSVLFIAAGYFMMAFIELFWVNCIAFVLVGLGSGAIVNVLCGRCSAAFPTKYRALVLGFLKTAQGVSGLLWSGVYNHLFRGDLTRFFFVIAVTVLICGVLALCFVEKLESVQSPSLRQKNQDPYLEQNYLPVNITGLNLFRHYEFWLLSLSVFINHGVSISWIGEMGFALQDDSKYLINSVYIFIAVNTLGRLLVGIISDLTSKTKVLSRAGWIMVGSLLEFIGCALYCLIPSVTTISIMSVLIGFSYGLLNVMYGVVSSFIFGTKGYIFNAGCLRIAGGFGGLMFALSKHALVQSISCTDHILCYRLPFLICVGFLFGGVILAVFIVRSYPV